MKKRSLITSIYAVGQLAFVIQIIIQIIFVTEEVKHWNNRVKKKDFQPAPDIWTNTCAQANFSGTLESKYKHWQMHKRDALKLQVVLIPLAAVCASCLLAAIVINSGSINVSSIFVRCCHISEACISRLAAMFWFICWIVEGAVSVFAFAMTTLAGNDLTSKKYKKQLHCRDSGQEIPKDKEDEVKCFRQLGVCPTAQEQTVMATQMMCIFVLFCVVSKICFRIFMDGEDNDRPKCENCCMWSHLRCACCKKKKPQEREKDSTKKSAKDNLGADSVITLHLDGFDDGDAPKN